MASPKVKGDFMTALEKERKQYAKQQYRIFVRENDITPVERKSLLEWVNDGNSVYDNPWYVSGEDGWPLNFVDAQRFIDELHGEMMAMTDEEREAYLNPPLPDYIKELLDNPPPMPDWMADIVFDELPFN
jgi:hypothetical protein